MKTTNRLKRMTMTVVAASVLGGGATLLGPAPGAFAATCSPSETSQYTVSNVTAATKIQAATARTVDYKRRSYATARGVAKASASASVRVTESVTVDMCTNGVSNPQTRTASITGTAAVRDQVAAKNATVHSYYKAKAKAKRSARYAAKAAARDIALGQARAIASARAESSAYSKARQDARAASSTPTASPASTGGTATGSNTVTHHAAPSAAEISSEIVRLSNIERTKVGAPAVSTMLPLTTYGNDWANHIGDESMRTGSLVVTHSGPNQTGPNQMTFSEFSRCTTAQRVAEIIVSGPTLDWTKSTSEQATLVAQNAIGWWLNSPGHRAILLDPYASRIGSGVALKVNSQGDTVAFFVSELFRGDCAQVA
jgi:uncharacterized protein YkwD